MSTEALQQAFAALQQGRYGDARRQFEALTGRADAPAVALVGLAHACAGSGDDSAADRAVDAALARDPRNVRGLLFKAERLVAAGLARRALPLYEHARRAALDSGASVPADVAQGLRRGEALAAKFAAEYGDFLTHALRARGYRPEHASAAFNQSLDICLGRRQVYYQQPSRFYFPGLPQRQFYERDEFPWLPALERATADIRAELRGVMAEPDRFKPYLQSDTEAQVPDAAAAGIMDNPDWGALYLWEYGQVVEANATCFPRTMQVLQDVPLPAVRRQLPIVLFSRLAAGTHIPPHHGMLNTRLICHLPLIVPEHCGTLRCGSEQRPWVEGETLIFDDSIEHEAWNRSDAERVVLLFDIWRPELSEQERRLVTDLLEVVKEYNDQPA